MGDDGPGRRPEVSDEEILQAVAVHPDPVVTATEIGDAVDMSNQGVGKRLRDLEDEGLLARKIVGASSVVYWLTREGREELCESI